MTCWGHDSFQLGREAVYTQLIGDFESTDYTLYSKALKDVTRSIAHFRSHWIQIDTHLIKGQLSGSIPHFVWRITSIRK